MCPTRLGKQSEVMTYLIGIDGGTESLRASVFDLTGRCLGFATRPYATQFALGSRSMCAAASY